MTPNLPPLTAFGDKRILIAGEAPGETEEKMGRPFCGKSGNYLSVLLSRAGISRDSCFLANVSQHRPTANDISTFAWSGLQIQHGLGELRKAVDSFNPNIVVLLRNVPLKAAMDPLSDHPLKPKAFDIRADIS